MAYQKDTGNAGWLLGFAQRTVEHAQRKIRQEYEETKDLGCELALKKMKGEHLTLPQIVKMQTVAVKLAQLTEGMGMTERSLGTAAEMLGLHGDPTCECDECMSDRHRFCHNLLEYWGTDDVISRRIILQNPSHLFPSGSTTLS